MIKADPDGALGKSFSTVYNELKNAEEEDAKETASPAWMNGITYSNIETVAIMAKDNTNIIVTGDSSRNKTQVMPGGVSVSKPIMLSNTWDSLVTSINYNPIENFYLTAQDHTVTPPANIPSVLTNGTYRILDPTSGATYLTRAGRLYYDSAANTLHYYAENNAMDQQPTVTPTESTKTYILGDADGSGEVTILDATIIQRYLVGYTVDDPETLLKCGDIDGNELNIVDATTIQRHLVGYSSGYPIGEIIS